VTHDKGPSIHNVGSGDTQSHEPIPHLKTLGRSSQRTIATALVMSGTGPARFVGGSSAGLAFAPLRCSSWRGSSWRSPCSCWREAGGWRRPTAVGGGLIGRTAPPTL